MSMSLTMPYQEYHPSGKITRYMVEFWVWFGLVSYFLKMFETIGVASAKNQEVSTDNIHCSYPSVFVSKYQF